jgi:arylsulfatase A-like enzyme/Flp pilus assembly protein TadD
MNKLFRIGGLVAVVAGLFLLWLAFFGDHGLPKPKNVILITLDTTRPDALGPYGGTDALTPVLDRMAARGNVFDHDYSQAPITLPSHTSIMTGLIPPQHGVRNNISYRLAPEHRTLASILREHGYATAAFVSSVILDHKFGLDQGFDVYEDKIVNYAPRTAKAIVTRRGGTTLDAALAWFGKHESEHPEQAFFSWIHFYDAHAPYDPPLPFKQAYADSPYHGEIAYMDQQLGRLVRFLEDKGLDKNTVIIVTADHGDSFGEHGEATHGFFTYSTTTHVPLIVSKPLYGKPGEHIEHIVESIDLAPSILAMLELKVPDEMKGALLSSTDARTVFSEAMIPHEDFYLAPLHSLKDDHYSFYYSSELELYNLQTDPQEKTNIAAQNPDLTARYLDTIREILETTASSDSNVAIDQATIEMLRSLGYVADGGASPAGASSDDFTLPSPLASLPVYRQLQNIRQFEDVYPFKMIEGLDKLSKKYPSQIIVHRDLGRLLVLGGKEDEGIDQLKQAAALKPSDPRLHTFLGLGYHQFGRFKEAVAEYELALELNPEHVIALYNLGLAQLALGDVEAARNSFESVVEMNPSDALALNNLAFIAYRHDKDAKKAQELIRRAATINPNYPLIKANLERFSRPVSSAQSDDSSTPES